VSLASMPPIKASKFSSKHLELSDVWTWQGDLYASEDSLIPVPLTEEELAEADSLLIHSKFRTASGTELVGLIVYQLGDDEVFSIEILAREHKFTFNKYLSDLSQEELARLATYLNEKVDDLLPIQYSLIPKEIAIEDGEFTF
jgi:hypothetical protein